MHKSKLTRSDFIENLSELHAQFDKAVQSFERQDFKASSEESARLQESMAKLVDALARDYGAALISHKLPRLPELAKNIDAETHLSEFTDALVLLNKYIDVLEKEVKRNYPIPSAWVAFLSKNRRAVIQGTLIFCVVVSLIGVWSYTQAMKTGLRGYYFAERNLAKLYKQRNDRKIDFNWGMNSPFVRWKKDNFSIQWTGYLRVPQDGKYEIYTHSDDGVRLVIGDTEVITNWTTHSVAINKAKIELKRGYYPIRLEYFEARRKAVIRLLWRRDGEPRASVISSDYLVPSKELLDPKIPLIEERAVPSGENLITESNDATNE